MSNYFHKNVKKGAKAKRQARQAKELSGGPAKVIKRKIANF
jgi:hypothetical protein